jgi:hypothetical protein
MATKTLSLNCDVAVRDILCTAIREYAWAVYPEGGSECAQVARYTLLQAADSIEAGISESNAEVQVRRRLRTNLKAALEYYFDRLEAQTGRSSLQQRERFAELLNGSPLLADDLDTARQADRAGV